MKITCECLLVANPTTGEFEPLVLGWPDGKIRELHNLRVCAYESGLRMKKGLSSYVGEGLGDNGGRFNIAVEKMKEDIYDQGLADRNLFEDSSYPSTVPGVLKAMSSWMDADERFKPPTLDPLSEFSEELSRKVFQRAGISKEDFTEIWNKTLGPALEDGSITWECSDRLAEYLTRIGNDELTRDEIFELIDAGKL